MIREKTAIALVSAAENLKTNMLIRYANIGNIVIQTALDTCATNCFVSNRMSERLQKEGYGKHSGPVRYDIRQGNPLCATNQVHMVPVTLISAEGDVVKWDMCMFIVADCGAEAIIGYPTLSKGQIISYYPPSGYERQLRNTNMAATTVYTKQAILAVHQSTNYEYGPPNAIANCFRTAARESESGDRQRNSATEAPVCPMSNIPPDYRGRLYLSPEETDLLETEQQFFARRAQQRTGPNQRSATGPAERPSQNEQLLEIASEQQQNQRAITVTSEQGCKPPTKFGKEDSTRGDDPQEVPTAVLLSTASDKIKQSLNCQPVQPDQLAKMNSTRKLPEDTSKSLLVNREPLPGHPVT